jgi:type II secretory pathway pseudopilin PulG
MSMQAQLSGKRRTGAARARPTTESASRRRRGDPGFTLLEITIILSVIAILGLILAPSVINFINNSRLARAQSDVDALANAVANFYRDNGFFPRYADASRTSIVSLLVTPGAVPTSGLTSETSGWATTDVSQIDYVVNQLVNNRPSFGNSGYPLRSAMSGAGWNGPYLTGNIQADPWGNRYVVNVGFLSVNLGALESGGLQEKRAVWALSAGPDGTIETVYPTATRQLVSDAELAPTDIGVRIQ